MILLGLIIRPKHHMVYLMDRPLDDILARRKRYELRLATMRAPFTRVQRGDLLLLKRSGGEVEAVARAGHVDRFDAENGDRLADFIARWATGDAERVYLTAKPDARYGVAIELINVRPATFPAEKTPRAVRSGWVADFDVGAWRAPRE